MRPAKVSKSGLLLPGPLQREHHLRLRGNFIELRDTTSEEFDLFVNSRWLYDYAEKMKKLSKRIQNVRSSCGLQHLATIAYLLQSSRLAAGSVGTQFSMSWIWRCIFCLQYFKRTFNFLTCSQAGFRHLVSYWELPKWREKHDTSWICSETAKPPKNPVLVSTGDPDQITPPQISMRLVPAILISSGGLRKPNKKTKEENTLVI